MSYTLNISALTLISVIFVTQVGRAECPNGSPVKITLSPAEFEIPGYDAEKGLLAVRPTKELLPTRLRKRAVRLLMNARDIVLPVGPDSLRMGLEQSSLLELHLEGEPVQPVTRLGMKPDCGQVVVKAASLRHDGVVLARGVVDVQHRTLTAVTTTLEIERGKVNSTSFKKAASALARACLQRATLQKQRVRGAISIQIEKSLVGAPLPPKVVVDGLVNPLLRNCLLMALVESKPIWSSSDAASRLYLNYFFNVR